jgi:hypothetical protein
LIRSLSAPSGVTDHSPAAVRLRLPDRHRVSLLQPKLEVIVMLTDELDVVIGVDTHRVRHALAMVAATIGIVVAEAEIAASGCGYRQALRLAKAQR